MIDLEMNVAILIEVLELKKRGDISLPNPAFFFKVVISLGSIQIRSLSRIKMDCSIFAERNKDI
jgi:hypothetical protein